MRLFTKSQSEPWAWLVVVAVLLAGCGAAPPAPTPTRPQPRRVTITGLDPVTKNDISPINVWDDYRTRARIVGRVSTGDTVTLLQEAGEGCQILLADGTVGWVSRGFIAELRAERRSTPWGLSQHRAGRRSGGIVHDLVVPVYHAS